MKSFIQDVPYQKVKITNSDQYHDSYKEYKRRPLGIPEEGSGDFEEKASLIDQTHPSWVLYLDQVNKVIYSQILYVKNGLKIWIKLVRQYSP